MDMQFIIESNGLFFDYSIPQKDFRAVKVRHKIMITKQLDSDTTQPMDVP